MQIIHDVIAYVTAQPLALRWGLAAVVALLSVAGLITAALPILKPGKDYTNLRERIASWWVMVALTALALLAGW